MFYSNKSNSTGTCAEKKICENVKTLLQRNDITSFNE